MCAARPESLAEADAESAKSGRSDAGSQPLPRPEMPAGAVNTAAPTPSNTKRARQREAEEDRELIKRVQAGEIEAFRRLVERHQRRAFAVAFSLVRDENDAKELVQDAFVRVFRGLGSFQGGSSFFTWLYRIITNLSIDHIRKPGSKVKDLDESRIDIDEEQNTTFPFISRVDGADPIDVMRRREIAERLQAALDALPPYHRGVIVMREIDGLSYEEMAQAMGVSKGTIMSRLFHARQKLQRALADCYKEQFGRSPGERSRAKEGDASDEEGES